MSEASADTKVSNEDLAVFYRIISEDLAVLTLLHDKEPTAELLQSLRTENFPSVLGFKLIYETGSQAMTLLQSALQAMPERMDIALLDSLAADYANIYLNYGIQVSPEESVWVDEENLACQDSMFQVRNWYEQYGLEAENWRVRPDDHLVLQLQFLSHLFSSGKNLEDLRNIAQFMDEHILRWIMPFAERVAGRCDTAYFAGLAMLTGCYCEELRDLISKLLDEPRPSTEEIEERMKPRHEVEEVPIKFMPGTGPAV